MPILSEGLVLDVGEFVLELEANGFLFTDPFPDDSCPEADRDWTFSASHPAAPRMSPSFVPKVEFTK